MKLKCVGEKRAAEYKQRCLHAYISGGVLLVSVALGLWFMNPLFAIFAFTALFYGGLYWDGARDASKFFVTDEDIEAELREIAAQEEAAK